MQDHLERAAHHQAKADAGNALAAEAAQQIRQETHVELHNLAAFAHMGAEAHERGFGSGKRGAEFKGCRKSASEAKQILEDAKVSERKAKTLWEHGVHLRRDAEVAGIVGGDWTPAAILSALDTLEIRTRNALVNRYAPTVDTVVDTVATVVAFGPRDRARFERLLAIGDAEKEAEEAETLAEEAA